PQPPTWKRLGPQGGSIGVLTFDPANSNIVYAGGANGGMYKSTNGGDSWRLLHAPVKQPVPIAVCPSHPATIYALIPDPLQAYHTNVVKSEDAGKTSKQLLHTH